MVALRINSRRAARLTDLKVARHESIASEQFRPPLYSQTQRMQLAHATGIENDSLLRRMLDEGLNPENVIALKYAPVAEVAWASGRVTDAEYVMALRPTFSADLFESHQATEQFRSWLKNRPHANLWSLWEDYVRACRARHYAATDRQFGQQLYDIAVRVALASGGIVDQGDICPAERSVLDRIAGVFEIHSDRLRRRTSLRSGC